MFKQIFDNLQRKRRQELNEDLKAWYQLCCDVSRTCGETLNNETIGSKEIGEVLDKTDRMLFRMREYLPGHHPLLKRRSPELARWVHDVSEQVYQLRNQTASFLIHCQGPVPLVSRPEGEARRVYYSQALETFGHEARRLWRELDSELTRIGEDIQRFGAELEQ